MKRISIGIIVALLFFITTIVTAENSKKIYGHKVVSEYTYENVQKMQEAIRDLRQQVQDLTMRLSQTTSTPVHGFIGDENGGYSLVLNGAEITISRDGAISIDSATAVHITGTTAMSLQAPLLRLNNGTQPIARVTSQVQGTAGTAYGEAPVFGTIINGGSTVLVP